MGRTVKMNDTKEIYEAVLEQVKKEYEPIIRQYQERIISLEELVYGKNKIVCNNKEKADIEEMKKQYNILFWMDIEDVTDMGNHGTLVKGKVIVGRIKDGMVVRIQKASDSLLESWYMEKAKVSTIEKEYILVATAKEGDEIRILLTNTNGIGALKNVQPGNAIVNWTPKG